jgi:eukaryotic-like serine/threonine-protein kinase
MGEVYRATDTKLKRQVANHPHIAAVYGLEDSGGGTALVMELVAGEDLSQRISRGPVPGDEALPVARQIADALEAAHEQGIIHRDLKPANIRVRPDGAVKVLDFGLAKALDPATSVPGGASEGALLTAPPTITSPALLTGLGMVLGTAAYMSPEQARGRPRASGRTSGPLGVCSTSCWPAGECSKRTRSPTSWLVS